MSFDRPARRWEDRMALGDIRPQGLNSGGNGSGLCANLGSGISGVEPSVSVTRNIYLQFLISYSRFT
jgi:hypothetical protein